MTPGDIKSKGNHYRFGPRGDIVIDKRRGSGRTLAYLFRHTDTNVDLDTISRVSGWQRNRVGENMTNLRKKVNSGSEQYTLERERKDHKVTYILYSPPGGDL